MDETTFFMEILDTGTRYVLKDAKNRQQKILKAISSKLSIRVPRNGALWARSKKRILR